MKNPLFVDTWGWVILANEKEAKFRALADFYRKEAREEHQIVTSDYILDELVTFLFAKAPQNLAGQYLEKLFLSIDRGYIRLERIHPPRFEKSWKLRLKYKDHPKISFTDLTSMVVMQELKIKRVMTQDQHFKHVNLGLALVPEIV